jgi:preprotein translocase subunit SecG
LPPGPSAWYNPSHFRKDVGRQIVTVYLNIIQIIISVALIAVILIQAKGSGLGSVFGGDSSIYTTRRGVDKTLFQATIGLSIAFFAISILNVVVVG